MASDQRAEDRAMRFAYADPPYLGCCGLYGHHHPVGERLFDGRCWDDVETHRLLISWLNHEFPDGWALSGNSTTLQQVLPMCPTDIRIGSWVKSFSAFKKGVRPAYAWEPIIFRGGRNPSSGYRHAPPEKGGKQNTPKDFHLTESDDWEVIISPITLKKGLTGAKPEAVCHWVLDLLNVQAGDTVEDVFTGTGVMATVASERTTDAA